VVLGGVINFAFFSQLGEDRLGEGSFRRFQLPSSYTLSNALPITIAYSRAVAQNITNPLP
jgi:hypothetical protein